MVKAKRISKKEVLAMDDKAFTKFVIKVVAPTKKKRKSGVYLQFPYDLRSSFDDKINEAAVGKRWTAFVNNAGTLAHVMCPEADILIRIKFEYPINMLPKDRMREVIMTRVDRWILI